MRDNSKTLQIITELVFFGIGIGIIYFSISKSIPRKIQEHSESTQNNQVMSILKEADRYTLLVSKFDFHGAKAMSTSQNIVKIDSVVKPKFLYWSKKMRVKKITFASVHMDRVLLVGNSTSHLVVTETLEFANPRSEVAGFFLRIKIDKVGNKFMVDNTEIVEKPLR